jgi:hypothetical protein
MKDKNEELLVAVFSGSPWEAELVKGLLESNGIPASLKDGMMATIAPYINDEVVVQVNEENYESAMVVVRDREKKEDD